MHLDDKAIEHFVQHDLLPQILRHAERHSRPDEPIGASRGWAEGTITIDSDDGRGRVMVPVAVDSVNARSPFLSVLSGRFNRASGVTVFLNGALTPRQLASGDRQQPIWSCRHETCIAYGIYSILLHELTHAAERALGPRAPGYSPSDVDERGEAAYGPYVNDPAEVRAFMQQIVDEVSRNARNEAVREQSRSDRNPNRALVDTALLLSTTWSLTEKHFTPRNRARILKAVHEALGRLGLLQDDRTARIVAARYTALRE